MAPSSGSTTATNVHPSRPRLGAPLCSDPDSVAPSSSRPESIDVRQHSGRSISEQQLQSAYPVSAPRAADAGRSSTFGSMFRSRIDNPGPGGQPQPAARPQVASSALPPPLPNPHVPGYGSHTLQGAALHVRPTYPPDTPISAPYGAFQPGFPPPVVPQPASAPSSYPSQAGTSYAYHQPITSPVATPTHTHFGASPSDSLQSPLPPTPHDDGNAELAAALRASENSAADDVRRREAKMREEEAHYLALHQSEVAERSRRAAEEEVELRRVMEASEREEREAQERRLARQQEEEAQAQLLLEESRQVALREDEARIQREHADVIARSRREAMEEEQRRRTAVEQQRMIEEATVRESLREMEEEWRRRDEAERAVAAHIHNGGQLGSASYWQHLDQKKAYDLALEMDKRMTLSAPSTSVGGPSRSRRPLPPTPGLAALQAGVERCKPGSTKQVNETIDEEDEVWVPSDDELIGSALDDEGNNDEDPFSDQAEAPPTYDEVHEDRPPDAPASIPGHVQLARPPNAANAQHNNTIQAPALRPEKTAAITAMQADTTSVAPPRSSSTSSQRILSSQSPPSSGSPSISAQATSPTTSTSQNHGSIETAPSSSTAAYTPPTTEEGSSPADTNEFRQKAMKGTAFGYCSEPFGTSLDLPEDPNKTYFPSLVHLRKAKLDGSLHDPLCFFVIRAPSWKALLRALAWYGNTRIEAGPEEVVDHPSGVPLRVEVDFVTPSKLDSLTDLQCAHVSVCFSLAVPSLAEHESKRLLTSFKQSSRALDASYLRQGATRRVIALPSQAPLLPLAMVRLAQHMHRAHIFSAACPSTGTTALHSPRDLHYAVERHDVGYVAKFQRRRRDATRTDGANHAMPIGLNTGAAAGNAVASGSDRRVPGHGQSRGSAPQGRNADEDELADMEDGQGDILDAGAVEIVDGDDRDSSRMARMRARVRRRLAKRSGDPRTVDEDLESWISELHDERDVWLDGILTDVRAHFAVVSAV